VAFVNEAICNELSVKLTNKQGLEELADWLSA
jgi:hypothetical protein